MIGGPGILAEDFKSLLVAIFVFFSSYNAMSIRRLERDTSVDRLSTGSGASNMSTQSEWVDGQKVWSIYQFYLSAKVLSLLNQFQ